MINGTSEFRWISARKSQSRYALDHLCDNHQLIEPQKVDEPKMLPMCRPDASFHEMMNRLTECIIVRNLQSFPKVFFIISRVENEYQCQFTIDVDCSEGNYTTLLAVFYGGWCWHNSLYPHLEFPAESYRCRIWHLGEIWLRNSTASTSQTRINTNILWESSSAVVLEKNCLLKKPPADLKSEKENNSKPNQKELKLKNWARYHRRWVEGILLLQLRKYLLQLNREVEKLFTGQIGY